ncbi:hypothetical protein B0H66DRAFT_567489 [Apodospora peruviana]|uniref:Secreted protein n=1 Tax=Apodospora peruviana TaxID=516989 RepID=A0AAE0LZT1_9PEZI|nr:hypothetical protein B0H66DRAFT_567489 [Apodospora peruviana]
MKFYHPILLFTGLTTALALPSSQRAQTSNLAIIQSASFSGSGCPPNTYSIDLASDGQAITLGFDAYNTLVGPGSDPSDREKNCDLTLTLQYPIGCTAAKITSTYHGFAQLEQGVTGIFSSQYNISPGSISSGGSPPPATISRNGFGGAGNVYTKLDEARTKVNVRSANQRSVSFVVRSRVLLQANNGNVGGLLTEDDVSISIAQQSRC